MIYFPRIGVNFVFKSAFALCKLRFAGRHFLTTRKISAFFRTSLGLVLSFMLAHGTNAESLGHTVVTKDFNLPWAVEFATSDMAYVTEREGRLWRYNVSKNIKTEITGVPKVNSWGQGGLLDIALDPDFKINATVYLCYTHSNGKGFTTRLGKAVIKGNTLNNVNVLFSADPYYNTNHHFGCRIIFDKKKLLYLSVGDRGNRDLAQSLSTHNGKIIRLTREGGIPDDNPFVKVSGAKPEIFSYGHRNPQGLVYDDVHQRILSIEHGPKGGDEINIVMPGKNYGWPIITYGKEYSGGKVGQGITHKKGMEQPLYYYTPSIAPCGADIYTGPDIPNAFGSVFIGALKLQHLNQVSFQKGGLKPKEKRFFTGLKQRIRDVKQSPDKKLYFITDNGWLVRINGV